jgi:hypothetical protein
MRAETLGDFTRRLVLLQVEVGSTDAREKKFASEEIHRDLSPFMNPIVNHSVYPDRSVLRGPIRLHLKGDDIIAPSFDYYVTEFVRD